MILHLVFFRFKEEDKEKNMKRVKKDLEALKMKEIMKLEVGVNYNDSDKAWDLSLLTEFATHEDLAAYELHPPHLDIVEFISEVCSEVAVVDYEK